MCDKKTLKAENEALHQRVRDLEQLVSELASKVKPPTVINIPAPTYPTYPVYPGTWRGPFWFGSPTVTNPIQTLIGRNSDDSAARN